MNVKGLNMGINPFSIKKPDDMDPAYVAEYFVDTHTDFTKILEAENTFINGARGTGKSMLLRSLEISVMANINKVDHVSNLDHLGVHVSLRKEDFGITEYIQLFGAEGAALGEHLLVMSICYHLFRGLHESVHLMTDDHIDKLIDVFSEYYCDSGGDKFSINKDSSHSDKLHRLQRFCERSGSKIRAYAKSKLTRNSDSAYTGPLCGFRDFLLPLIDEAKYIKYLPDKPVFIMLDDADNLPKSMQRIINSWISMRVYPKLCLKVSTQLGYATYRTLDNRLIESPHDYTNIDVGSVYTNTGDRYSKRIEEIVTKRLALAEIHVKAKDFFPINVKQIQKLDKIKVDIRNEFKEGKNKGSSRVNDEVTRYAIPRLMRELYKTKSAHTFSYAGYDSLVNLSSGVIRWFLEPAAKMYDEVMSENKDKNLEEISVSIQDRIITEWSKSFAGKLQIPELDDDINDDVIIKDASLHALTNKDDINKLHNLINGLGNFFRYRILDENASEQRAFSIVIRQDISNELAKVLGLGVRLGYLQKADNSSKELFGSRRPRYILARRLGPHFRLDISGYAAHLSVTAEQLEIAIIAPDKFVKLKTVNKIKDTMGQQQLFLLDEGE